MPVSLIHMTPAISKCSQGTNNIISKRQDESRRKTLSHRSLPLYQCGMSKCVIIMNTVVLTQISTLIIGATLAANRISFAMAESEPNNPEHLFGNGFRITHIYYLEI